LGFELHLLKLLTTFLGHTKWISGLHFVFRKYREHICRESKFSSRFDFEDMPMIKMKMEG